MKSNAPPTAKRKTYAVSHAGGGVHNPDEILTPSWRQADAEHSGQQLDDTLNPVEPFLRSDRMPHIWCRARGCNGIRHRRR